MSKITFRTEESKDPDHPGIWTFAMVDGKEVCCSLLEVDPDNMINLKAWNQSNYEDDPVVTLQLASTE